MSVKKCLPRHAGAFLARRFSRDGSASGYRAAPPVSQAVTAKVKNRVGGVSTAFSSEESQHQRGTLRVEDSALRGGTFRPQHPAHRNHSSVSPPPVPSHQDSRPKLGGRHTGLEQFRQPADPQSRAEGPPHKRQP